jgi:hypothetical protein
MIGKDSISDFENFTRSQYKIIRDSIVIEYSDHIVKDKITFIGRDTFYIGSSVDVKNEVFCRIKK